jgi:cobalt-zinc-cadmium efflux system membrane fusion protein
MSLHRLYAYLRARPLVSLAGAVLLLLSGWYFGLREKPRGIERASSALQLVNSVALSEKQASSLRIETVAEREFVEELQSIGSIDFNQNRLVTVFTPYQGRIINSYPNIGDAVEKDQVLFTIDSPDLLTAESALIAAAGVHTLQMRTLNRVKSLIKIGGVSQQVVDQTTSDQQTAEGALKSARDAVRIFGKTEEEIEKIISERRADPRLIVKSPISGFVTARSAAPGLFVQPGVAPAPFTVADTSTMWMVANVPESDAPQYRVGQEVTANVAAYPGRAFEGRIIVVGPSVDPVTRRIFMRSEIADPDHLLRAGMFANFSTRIKDPVLAPAVPQAAVVREGDGGMTIWTTTDRKTFTRRLVKIGLRQNDLVEIVEGVKPGELVVGEGAVFLSNFAAASAAQ